MMCGWGKCRTWGNNTTPLYCLPATTVAGWLEDLEQIRNYEYAHIFDDRFTRCFFVTDDASRVDTRYVATLRLFLPL